MFGVDCVEILWVCCVLFSLRLVAAACN